MLTSELPTDNFYYLIRTEDGGKLKKISSNSPYTIDTLVMADRVYNEIYPHPALNDVTLTDRELSVVC